MFGYSNIAIDFLTGSPMFVWPALAATLVLSIFLYTKTNPPLPRWPRIGMAGLRLIAVLALFAALLEPVLSYSRGYDRSRRVSILVDHSASMGRLESGLSRRNRLDSVLSHSSLKAVEDRLDVSTFYFSNRLEKSADDLDRDRTALGDVLAELTQRELGSPADNWLLFSDGRSNSGREPAEVAKQLSTPVSSIYMAAERGSFDVSLAEVDVNPVLFVGKPTQIRVKLAWHDAKGKVLRVRLSDGATVRAEASYTVDQDDGFGELAIKYLPERPGQKLLTLKIPEMAGEESDGNNQRSVAVTVLKSKLNVLLVSERPDYEVGFLQRHLRRSEKYELTLVLTGKKGGNLSGIMPSRQAELNRYDLIVLHDPDPRQLIGHRKVLESYLSDKGGGVCVLMGDRFSSAGPAEWFNNLLPFSQSRRIPVSYREFKGVPAEGNLFHPAVRLADDRASIRAAWASLPPFESLVRCDNISPQGITLATASDSRGGPTDFPILGYRRIGPGKLIAIAALPLWNWGFLNRGFGEDYSFYGMFLDGVVSWLTIPEEFDPIRIAPDKQVFSRGETVRFQGSAFDQGFRPIPGVSGLVKLTAEKGPDIFEVDLIENESGNFDCEFSALPPGQYKFVGRFEKGGVTLKSQSGHILVEPYSLEEMDRSGDPGSMMAIARLSGGNFYSFDEVDKAIAALDLSPIFEREAGEIALWGRFWLLVIFLAALSSEWILRKLNQLI